MTINFKCFYKGTVMADLNFDSHDKFIKYLAIMKEMKKMILNDFKRGVITIKDCLTFLDNLEEEYHQSYTKTGFYTSHDEEYVCCVVYTLIEINEIADDDQNGFTTMKESDDITICRLGDLSFKLD